mgnify:CR=1 FL=1
MVLIWKILSNLWFKKIRLYLAVAVHTITLIRVIVGHSTCPPSAALSPTQARPGHLPWPQPKLPSVSHVTQPTAISGLWGRPYGPKKTGCKTWSHAIMATPIIIDGLSSNFIIIETIGSLNVDSASLYSFLIHCWIEPENRCCYFFIQRR